MQKLAQSCFTHCMAKRTEVREVLEDDLDGSPADRTVQFGWEGSSFEIELSKKNATAFEKAMKPYVDVARRVRGGGTTRQRSNSQRGSSKRGSSQRAASRRSDNKRDLGAIREWASQNGYEVSTRGRIAGSVVEAYNAAHS